MKHIRALLPAAAGGAAWAHPGHGLGGPHWHAADASGWVLLALIVAAALWVAHRK